VPEADEGDSKQSDDITETGDVVVQSTNIEFRNFKKYPKIKDYSKREKL